MNQSTRQYNTTQLSLSVQPQASTLQEGILSRLPIVTTTPDSSNVTNNGTVIQPRHVPLFDTIAVHTLIVISCYLLIATIIYTVRKKKDKVAPHLHRVNALCVVATSLLLFESCWFLVEVYVTGSATFCTAYSATNVTVGTINRAVIYTILWLRQRAFYRKRPTACATSRTINLLSNALLGGILMFALIQIMTMSSIPILSVKGKCVTGKPSGFLNIFAPIIFFIIALFQVVLLLPILYPVVKHVHSRRTGQNKGRLDSVITRLCISGSVCVLTDIGFLILSANDHPSVSFSFIPICYAFNTVINVTSTIMSFSDFSNRLLPLRCGCVHKKEASLIPKEIAHQLTVSHI
nr:uncharacterized protein LOC100177193 [Ciona intestinalis]|eukprot:XP_002128436.1 uncharacterized protein LOC100177193 [Ciona intestinalis]